MHLQYTPQYACGFVVFCFVVVTLSLVDACGTFTHLRQFFTIDIWIIMCRNLSQHDIPIWQIPQCIRQISHNAPFCNRNVHISVTKQNRALWDMGLMHFGICAICIFLGITIHCLMNWFFLCNKFAWLSVFPYRKPGNRNTGIAHIAALLWLGDIIGCRLDCLRYSQSRLSPGRLPVQVNIEC